MAIGRVLIAVMEVEVTSIEALLLPPSRFVSFANLLTSSCHVLHLLAPFPRPPTTHRRCAQMHGACLWPLEGCW